MRADEYERGSWKLGTPRGEYVRERRLKAVLPLVEDATLILDIGCGPATLSKDFPCRVIGVDLDRDMFIKGRIDSLLLADGQHLPFKDHVFDISYESSCIYQVSDKLLMLKEMIRVSRARIITFESNGWSLRRIVQGITRKSREEHPQLTPVGLRKYYKKLGLEPRTKMVGFAPFTNNRFIFKLWRPVEWLIEHTYPLALLTGGMLVYASVSAPNRKDSKLADLIVDKKRNWVLVTPIMIGISILELLRYFIRLYRKKDIW